MAESRRPGGVWGPGSEPGPGLQTPERAALRRRWANLVRRVYETDPLVCPRCGSEMRVIGFISDPRVVRRIVDHLRKRDTPARPPPPRAPLLPASPSSPRPPAARQPCLSFTPSLPRDAGGESCRPGTYQKAVGPSHPVTRPVTGILRSARGPRERPSLPT